MNTTIRTICAAAVVMAAVSCQKSIEPANPAEEGKETIDICVNGLMGEYTQVDGTKAELVNTVRVSWKGGETVYVYDETKCLGSLKASLEGDEDRYAVLSTDGSTHKVSTPADGTTTLTLVYSPLLTEAPTVSGRAISVSLASQSGEKAPFVAYATLEYTGTTIKNAVVPFKFATSVIKVNCTGLKPGTAITSATLSNVNTVCKLTLSGSAAPTVSGDINGTITRTGDAYFAAGKVNGEGEAVFQMAVPALEETSGIRILTITQGTDIFKDVKFSTKSIGSATSVNTVCQLFALPAGALEGVFSVSANKKVFFSKGNLYAQKTGDNWTWNFYDEQYKYNSIATSSGSRTAADIDTEIDLFTWGYSASTSLNPTGDSYVEAHTTDGDNLVYNKASSEGGDDWGVAYCESNNITVGTWRTLSKDEWAYLLNTRTVNGGKGEGKSYSLNITYGGKMGLVLYPDDYSDSTLTSGTNYTNKTFPADCVFLPAAGRRNGSDVIFVGGTGLYWSSTGNAPVPAYDKNLAYRVILYSSHVDHNNGEGDRSDGNSVRLITESK